MKVRRTITLDENDIKLLQPLIKKYEGNISRAIREVIRGYSYELTIPVAPEKIMEHKEVLRSRIINENIGYLIPLPLAFWLSQMVKGIVPPIGLYRIIIDKFFPEVLGIKRVDTETLLEYINPILQLWGAHSNLEIKYRWDSEHLEVTYEDLGYPGPEIPAMDCSFLLAHKPFLMKIVGVIRTPTYWRVRYEKAEDEEETREQLIKYFGENQEIYRGISENIEFWRNFIGFIRKSEYEVVVLKKREFMSIFKGNFDICDFEYNLSEDILNYIEHFGRVRGLIKKMYLKSNNTVVFQLAVEDAKVAEVMAMWISEIVNKSGRNCYVEATSPSSLTVSFK